MRYVKAFGRGIASLFRRNKSNAAPVQPQANVVAGNDAPPASDANNTAAQEATMTGSESSEIYGNVNTNAATEYKPIKANPSGNPPENPRENPYLNMKLYKIYDSRGAVPPPDSSSEESTINPPRGKEASVPKKHELTKSGDSSRSSISSMETCGSSSVASPRPPNRNNPATTAANASSANASSADANKSIKGNNNRPSK